MRQNGLGIFGEDMSVAEEWDACRVQNGLKPMFSKFLSSWMGVAKSFKHNPAEMLILHGNPSLDSCGGSDMVLGTGNYRHTSDLRLWIHSLWLSGFCGRVAFLHGGDMHDHSTKYLQQLGVEIYAVTQDEHGKSILKCLTERGFEVCRFWMVREFLGRKEQANIRYVLMTDIKDVIFQPKINPSVFLTKHMRDRHGNQLPDARLYTAAEGMLFQDEIWAQKKLRARFGEQEASRWNKQEIFNAGVIAAEREVLHELSFHIYLIAMSRGPATDQHVYNLLLHSQFLGYKQISHFTSGTEGWVANFGDFIVPEYKSKWLISPPLIDGKDVFTPNRQEQYAILHQYTRLPAEQATPIIRDLEVQLCSRYLKEPLSKHEL